MHAKVENGNEECQRDDNWTKDQKTTVGHQWVFITTRKSRTRRCASFASKQKVVPILINQWFQDDKKKHII